MVSETQQVQTQWAVAGKTEYDSFWRIHCHELMPYIFTKIWFFNMPAGMKSSLEKGNDSAGNQVTNYFKQRS